MATLTLRIDDEMRDQIEALARGRGGTVSDFVRLALDEVLVREEGEGPKRNPESLTLQERKLLAMQHQILALLSDENGWERDYHSRCVDVLSNGFVGEYESLFRGLDQEISLKECELLWRILDMFRILEFSINRLPDDVKVELNERVGHSFSFAGFDFNDSRELRFARYAKFLVNDGRWKEQADALEQEGGNSHMPMLEKYQRMLAVFEPIISKRGSDSALSFDDQLSLDVGNLYEIHAASSFRRS
jgi:hypothetical protein